MARIDHAVNIADVRRLAMRRLPRAVFEVIEGGAGDDTTFRANREDLESLRLVPRSLEDINGIDLTTTLFGQKMALPLMLAPASFGRMCDPAAERAVAKGAGKYNVGYIMPGGASDPVEAVAKVATGPLWYQIYMKPSDAENADLIQRVKDSGFQALVVTVDTPMKPYRERDMKNGISLPLQITPKLMAAGISRPKWAMDFVFGNMSSGFSLTAARSAYYNFDSAISNLRPVTLKEIEWLRERWDGPLIVKGILSDDKIRDMVKVGVDGVSVSNHGGRNLDGEISAIKALPRIVDTAAGDLEVIVDGGIRRGIDVVRALALGAKAVLMGRPYLYGLAAAGQRGVERVIELIQNEIRVAFAFTGSRTVDDITSELIAGYGYDDIEAGIEATLHSSVASESWPQAATRVDA